MGDAAPAEAAVRIFGPGTGPHYDRIVDVTTRGQDRVWKAALLGRLRRPRRILDLACGTGILTFALHELFPEAEIVGVDANEEYLEIARRRAAERRAESVELLLGKAEEIDLPGRFDSVVSCYLPKYADLGCLVPRLAGCLTEGGQLVTYDFVYPSDPVVERAWSWGFEQCRQWAAENVPEAVEMFEVLPGVIRRSCWLDELRERMAAAGFIGVSHLHMGHGQVALVQGILGPGAG